MFNYIPISILLLIAGVLALIGINVPIKDLLYGSIAPFSASLIWSFAAIINSLGERKNQLWEFETLRGDIAIYLNYKKVKVEISDMLSKYLGDEYPKYEEKVIGSMTSSAGLLIKYPELATSAIFIELTKKLTDIINSQQSKRDSIIRSAATLQGKLSSDWVWFKPPFPKDIEDIIRKEDF